MKVLVSDPIDQAGIDILSQVADVDQRLGLSLIELKGIIRFKIRIYSRNSTKRC